MRATTGGGPSGPSSPTERRRQLAASVAVVGLVVGLVIGVAAVVVALRGERTPTDAGLIAVESSTVPPDGAGPAADPGSPSAAAEPTSGPAAPASSAPIAATGDDPAPTSEPRVASLGPPPGVAATGTTEPSGDDDSRGSDESNDDTNPSGSTESGAVAEPSELAESTGTTEPPSTAAPSPEIRFETVPPVRDLVLRVGDELVATDGGGTVVVARPSADTAIEVVGLVAAPAIQRVEVSGWPDGPATNVRTAGELHADTVRLSLVVRRRATVTTDRDAGIDEVELEGSDGERISLTVGEPTWVVAAYAAGAGDDGATEVVEVGYRAVTATGPDGDVAIEPLEYRPTPEALWRVRLAG